MLISICIVTVDKHAGGFFLKVGERCKRLQIARSGNVERSREKRPYSFRNPVLYPTELRGHIFIFKTPYFFVIIFVQDGSNLKPHQHALSECSPPLSNLLRQHLFSGFDFRVCCLRTCVEHQPLQSKDRRSTHLLRERIILKGYVGS